MLFFYALLGLFIDYNIKDEGVATPTKKINTGVHIVF